MTGAEDVEGELAVARVSLAAIRAAIEAEAYEDYADGHPYMAIDTARLITILDQRMPTPMNDDTAEIEANVDNAYQTGIRDGRKLERERIAVAIEAIYDEHAAEDKAEGCVSQYCAGWLLGQVHAARVARTEPS